MSEQQTQGEAFGVEQDPLAETSEAVAARRGPADPRLAAREQRKPRWGFIILGSVVLLVAVAGFVWWFLHRNEQDTDDAFTDGRAVTLAPRVSGNIRELLVNDNQFVKAGQLLAKIGPRDFLAARDQAQGELLSEQAQLANAKASLAIIQLTQPAKLQQARAQLAAAQATQVRAQADFRRFHSIDPQATTRQDIDQATAASRQAAAQVAQAEAQVAQAGTVDLDVAQAQSKVAQLQGEVLAARPSSTRPISTSNTPISWRRRMAGSPSAMWRSAIT